MEKKENAARSITIRHSLITIHQRDVPVERLKKACEDAHTRA
jgi:hypothetical protein